MEERVIEIKQKYKAHKQDYKIWKNKYHMFCWYAGIFMFKEKLYGTYFTALPYDIINYIKPFVHLYLYCSFDQYYCCMCRGLVKPIIGEYSCFSGLYICNNCHITYKQIEYICKYLIIVKIIQ